VAGFTIRRMRLSDYDAAVEIWKAGGIPYKPTGRDSRERIEKELQQSSSAFLVAEADGKVVGVVLGTRDGRKMWMNRLGVHPSFRRRGVGAALLRELERMADAMGLLVCAALVEKENAASCAMMAKLGYEGHDELTYYVKKKTKGS
jgi:ribosomal protein S18 acetylase RimI-like enzyme